MIIGIGIPISHNKIPRMVGASGRAGMIAGALQRRVAEKVPACLFMILRNVGRKTVPTPDRARDMLFLTLL